MEKLLVFIPAYNCEKQVPRVLTQLLDPRVAPWVGACIVVNNRPSLHFYLSFRPGLENGSPLSRFHSCGNGVYDGGDEGLWKAV